MCFKRLLVALSCAALVTIGELGQSAQADVTSGTASAFGASANVDATAAGLGVLNTSLAPTPTVSGTAPPSFNLSNSAASATATVNSAFSAQFGTGLSNVTAASTVDGAAGAKSSDASSTVSDVFLFGVDSPFTGGGAFGLFATSLQSTAQVTGDFGALVPTGTATLTNGSLIIIDPIVFSLALPANPAPNTIITIDDALLGGTGFVSGSITLVLNEQILTGNGTSTQDITVNALDITFNNFFTRLIPDPSIYTGQVIIGQSHAGLQAGPNGGGGAQPVPEPSSLAMLCVAGVGGMITRMRKRKSAAMSSTSQGENGEYSHE